MGNWCLAASSQQRACSCITSCAEVLRKHQITQVTQLPYIADLAPCGFWLFPKLKSILKGKRFQTVDEIQENVMGQPMVTGRSMWGPKVSTLNGTEASLSYVQCFFYLVSSSINVSIFPITWLDISWTDLVLTKVKVSVMWKSTLYASWYNSKIIATHLRILEKCINHEETSDKSNTRFKVIYTPQKYLVFSQILLTNIKVIKDKKRLKKTKENGN